jgi:hypothetical protein
MANSGKIEHYIGRATGREAAYRHESSLLKKQWEQAQHPHAAVIECVCGRARAIELMFRCWHCGLWFCEQCSDDHYGRENHHETQ